MAVGSGFTFALSEAIALRTHYPGSYKTGCAVFTIKKGQNIFYLALRAWSVNIFSMSDYK